MKVQAARKAIEQAEKLADLGRHEASQPPASLEQVVGQMGALVDRVMGEAGLYAPEHTAIAVKQAQGDSAEATIILRAFRQSLPKRYQSELIDTEGMQIERRISSAFREIPGGQILGPTRDYTQRLLEENIAGEDAKRAEALRQAIESELTQEQTNEDHRKRYVRVSDLLKSQGLVKPVNEDEERSVSNVDVHPILYPAPRSAALQTLARSETGGMMALGYSAMRGQGGDHPTIGELRVGWVRLSLRDQRGRARCIGRIRVTESANISKIKTRKKDPVPYMSLGYGLCFGQNETKAICMGILDRSMRIPGDSAPAISQEFVLHHLEGPDSYGFVSSLRMAEHTNLQSELIDLRESIARNRKALESQTPESQPSPAAERDLV